MSEPDVQWIPRMGDRSKTIHVGSIHRFSDKHKVSLEHTCSTSAFISRPNHYRGTDHPNHFRMIIEQSMKWSRFPFQYSMPSKKYRKIDMKIEPPTSYRSFSQKFPMVFPQFPHGFPMVSHGFPHLFISQEAQLGLSTSPQRAGGPSPCPETRIGIARSGDSGWLTMVHNG